MKAITSPIGVAVVGLGVAGIEHARAYRTLPDCELKWLCDLDAEKAAGLAKELGAGIGAATFEKILADPAVEVISIASYDDAHFSQAISSLRAGKHVFVEKPLCYSLEELKTLKRVWQETGRRHLASNLAVARASTLYRWLREAIAKGELGELYAIDGEYLYGRFSKITEGWRKNVEDYSVMLGGGVHLVDVMLSLARERPVSVVAAGNRIVTSGTAFRYHDFAAATYTFPSGLIGRICANFGCVHRHQHILRVFGTKGTFLYDDQGARLWTSREDAAAPVMIDRSPARVPKGALIPEFIRRIREGQASQPDAQREFDLIAVCLAADRAVASSHPVAIEYL